MRQSPGAPVFRAGLLARFAVLMLAGGAALILAGCAVAGPSGTRPTPAKPAGAVVPAAVRVVTLSMNYGWNAGSRKPPAPVTITDPVTVGKVAALVDHVPPPPSGTYNCPFADEMAFDLAFRARPGGPVLAAAVLQLNGCEWVDLTVGKQDYSLGNPAGARPLATQVLKVTGVPWKLPPFQWPN